MAVEPKVKRVPVSFLWSKLNWDFLKMLAEIAQYAEGKYGSAEQYTNARLENQASPINHIYEHLRQYQAGEPHDRFGDPRYHLAAIAYNASMEYFYHTTWGQKLNVIMQRQRQRRVGVDVDPTLEKEYLQPDTTLAGAVGELPTPGIDWAEGIVHFRERWQSGLDGARTPETIRRWKAMLWVIEQFEGVATSDEAVRGTIEDIEKVTKELLESLSTPENVDVCQARLAACDTLRTKIPDMFPKKEGAS